MDDSTASRLAELLRWQFDDESEAISALMRAFGDALAAGIEDRRRTLALIESDVMGDGRGRA